MRWTAMIGRTDPWTWALAFAIGVGAFVGCSASEGGPEIGPSGTGGGANAGSSGAAGTEQGGGGGEDASIDDSSTGAGGTSGDGGSTGAGGQVANGGSAGAAGTAGSGGWENCVALPDPGPAPQPTDVVLGGAPANAATMFGGGVDPQRAPTIVYPPDGVLMPPNIATLDVQFLPGSGNDLFEVQFSSNAVNVRFYTKCSAVGAGCSLKLEGSNFSSMAAKAAGQEPMTLRIRGVSQASPSSVGESASTSVGIAEMPMLGGLYYWDASGEVIRYDFGYPTAKGEHYYTAFNGGGAMCVGCHSLSQAGHLMAVGLGMPAPSTLRVINVSDKSTIYTLSGMAGSNFQAFSPDESEIIVSNGKNMILRDTATGAAIKNPLVQKGTMPDYHPDNTGVVFSKSDDLVLMASPGITRGSIMLLPRNGATWGPEKTLVPTTNDDNNYYPAFSPDGSWIIFNRAHDDDSYLAPNSVTMVVGASGGTPVALAKANVSDQVGNSWPKWAPFKQCNRGKRLLWYTVSSARDYGLRIVNSDKQPDPDGGDPRRWQIWMAAFDPEKAAKGEDPSSAAFWLPFQDSESGNHIAQWVEKVIRNPCVDDSQCPSNAQQKMICKNNECVPQ